MPSTSVEFSFSNTLQFDEQSEILEISDVIYETIHPVWNQEFVMWFKEGEDFPEKGSLWVSIYD
jgi:general stress protein 26